MKRLAFTLLYTCAVHFCLLGQVDNYSKNSKIADDLEARYKKDLEEAPNSAVPHWKHANELSNVTFMAQHTAWKYYEKALSIDSANAEIYVDYGKHLSKNKKYAAALICFDKALMIAPENQTAITERRNIQAIIKKDEEYWALRAMPVTSENYKRNIENYNELVDFKKIFKQINHKKGAYYYPKLKQKFIENTDQLTDMESYMLIMGHTQQPGFKPYNYEPEITLQGLASMGKIDAAISMGQKMLETDCINLLVLREMVYCYKKSGNAALALRYEKQMIKILDGLLFSGNGSCDQPFMTISVQEEYLFVNYIGFDSTRDVTQANCSGQNTDKMKVIRQSDQTADIMYFNIEVLYQSILKK